MIFHLTSPHPLVGSFSDKNESGQHPGFVVLKPFVSKDGHAAIAITPSKDVS